MPSLVLFDRLCNWCDGFVQVVIARDPVSIPQLTLTPRGFLLTIRVCGRAG
jgi:predicted DCC family thiol-disulfide oxidoreductase YuxK